MRVIGLTGGIACGKSTVAELLRARGVPVVDADQVARDVVAPGTPGLAALVEAFGPGVLRPDGSLDRAALGARVRDDADARRTLEGLTHPRIWAALEMELERLRGLGVPVAVVEAALMVETGSYRRYDAVLVVSASPEVQVERLRLRNGWDEATARAWIATQAPQAAKEAVATAVLQNDGDRNGLASALDAIWPRLLGP